MATKRLKRNCGEKGVQNEPDIMAEDRILQLPDSLIHYIFSFLPTIHLIRMSRVSRCWRRMWVSTPFLHFDCHFDDVTFTKKVNRSNMFLKFVGNCLSCRELYMQPDTFITSFKLHSYYKLGRHAAQQVDKWVRFAIQSKVKELDLRVQEYCIPQFVFTTSSLMHALEFEVASFSTSSSLTQLKLRALKLEVPFLSKFPSLKVLSLSHVESNYESFQNLISGCLIIEDLHLQDLNEMHPVHEYECYLLDISNIDLPAKTLKNLSLVSVKCNDQWLECLISGLSLLERFSLTCFHKVNISVHSHSLKYLSIDPYGDTIKATFVTPNLVYLYLRCDVQSIISVESPNLFQANLSLSDGGYRSASCFDLLHFLANIHSLKKMKLSIFWEEDMIIPDDIRNTSSPPLPNLKHLEGSLYDEHKKNSELRDFLVWCAPSVETLKINGESYFFNFAVRFLNWVVEEDSITMARKRVKRNCGEKKAQNELDIMAEDCISQLPDSLIHYIFSFLPTIYLVRMSCVSRRWRRMWVSTPFLYFDCQFHDVTFTNQVNRLNMFRKFVGNCLRCRKLYMQPDTFITSFKLHTRYKLGSYAAQQVDKWVRFAIQSNVKELDLKVGEYCVPQFVYTGSSWTQLRINALECEVDSLSTSSSLTKLELKDLKLEIPFLSEFPSLKVLSVSQVKSNYESFQNLISGCLIIEDLHLEDIKEIHPVHEHGRSLLDISNIDFPAKTLKNLSFFSVKCTCQWLECLISGLPLLERFTLACFHKLNISIHSHSLKYLSLNRFGYTTKATIVTPNLVYLFLRRDVQSIISFEAPNLFQANLTLTDGGNGSASCFDLAHFLANFHGFKKMKLSILWIKDAFFPEDIRNTLSPPLPNLKHLEASFSSEDGKNSELRDFLVWCAPSVETLKINGRSLL